MERHLIAGDIHGQYERLREALDKASFNPDTDILYSTGDISDRGPHGPPCAIPYVAP